MNNSNKISFIPKKPLVKKRDTNTRPMSILLFASLFVFFLTLAVHGGLYFYYSNLKKTVEEKVVKLEDEKKKADPSDAIDIAKKLQLKISSANKLLDSHLAPSRVFELLEEVTLKNIVLDTLTLGKDTLDEEKKLVRINKSKVVDAPNFIIRVSGKALSYASLAYQSDVLKEEMANGQRVKSFLITNPEPDKTGGISFNLDIELYPEFLSYKNLFVKEAAEEVASEDTSIQGKEVLEDILPKDTADAPLPEQTL